VSAFLLKVVLFVLWSLVDAAVFYFIGYRQAKRGLGLLVKPTL
jgi:hypothetical protein